ncbi:15517_t:CDS:2, partial [Acaulospora colombiana]
MSSHTIEDLTNSILDFQGNMVRVAFFKKTRRVLVSGHFNGEEDGYDNGYAGDGEQEAMLEYIWSCAKLEQDDGSRSPTTYLNGYGEPSAKARGKGSTRDIVKWRKLGFETEDMRRAFEDTGMLGLECLSEDVLSQRLQTKLSKFFQSTGAFLLLDVSLKLCDSRTYQVTRTFIDSTSTSFQPFFLSFHRVHALALQFFLRMWNESGATSTDFSRFALRNEAERPWHEVEADFLESEYRAVRDRQMKELELEDDLLTKVPVRNLRAKLYKESYEFIRQQRIQCLIQGAWFVNGIPLSPTPGMAQKRQTRPW